MLTRMWLSCACILLASVAPSHAQDLKPPKKAATILVHTADPPDTAYKTVARLLLAQGYGLQSADGALGFATTNYKEVKNGVTVQLTASVAEDSTGTVVRLTGTWKWPIMETVSRGSGDVPETITYRGSNGSASRLAWDALFAVAAGYAGGTISYIDPKSGEGIPGVAK